MLLIEDVSNSNMTRQLQLVRIQIDLLNNLNRTNLFGRKFVVVTHLKTIFTQNNPNKVARLNIIMNFANYRFLSALDLYLAAA